MEKKILNVALIGEPNAGKSSLLNKIIGEELSIVTHKVQTTRFNIKGILQEDNIQVVFIDTPGLFDPDRAIEKAIVKNAKNALEEAEVICVLFDPKRVNDYVVEILNSLKLEGKKFIAIINKVDTIDKPKLLPLAKNLEDFGIFEEIFFLSALKGAGVKQFKEYLKSLAKPGEFQFDEDAYTDQPVKTIAEEITREQVYLYLHKELPYSIKIETERWLESGDGHVAINQVIYVLKESQKVIVLGKNGQKIKEIGQRARHKIAKVLGLRVQLFLHVKVQEDWIDRDFKEFR